MIKKVNKKTINLILKSKTKCTCSMSLEWCNVCYNLKQARLGMFCMQVALEVLQRVLCKT